MSLLKLNKFLASLCFSFWCGSPKDSVGTGWSFIKYTTQWDTASSIPWPHRATKWGVGSCTATPASPELSCLNLWRIGATLGPLVLTISCMAHRKCSLSTHQQTWSIFRLKSSWFGSLVGRKASSPTHCLSTCYAGVMYDACLDAASIEKWPRRFVMVWIQHEHMCVERVSSVGGAISETVGTLGLGLS